jgi:hypothetical protein
MLEKVKLALRITSAAFDSEIKSIISAAYADLRISGIEFVEDDPDDALIERAVIIYSKCHFGFLEKSEQFEKTYNSLKQALMIGTRDKVAPESESTEENS